MTDFRPPRGLPCWAGPLCVPVGGVPPARRPRRELRSACRLEARPGPAGPAVASTPAAPAVLCVVACRLEARPGPAGPAAASTPAVWRHHRPPAPRQFPPTASYRVWLGALVCCSLFRNVACNSPPALCWFVSVCSVVSLVFMNCMRLLPAGPAAAQRHRGEALRTLSALRIDETGCVRG